MAARWYTTSAPSTSSRTVAGSRTSPNTTSTWSVMSASSVSSQPVELNMLYRTMARTRFPRRTSASTTWEPIKPSAPVTATTFVMDASFQL